MFSQLVFFINDTTTTEIYTYGHTLSLHCALPILCLYLETNSSVPRASVLAVAKDQNPVAYAILMEISVLADPELLEVVRHRALQHQLALARRRGVSGHMSDVLAQKIGRASCRERVCQYV